LTNSKITAFASDRNLITESTTDWRRWLAARKSVMPVVRVGRWIRALPRRKAAHRRSVVDEGVRQRRLPSNRPYGRKEFKELFEPRPVRTYSRKSLAKAICKHGYYDYCFGDRKICRLCDLRIKGRVHRSVWRPRCDDCAERHADLEGGRR
jgi:hypothetical protein